MDFFQHRIRKSVSIFGGLLIQLFVIQGMANGIENLNIYLRCGHPPEENVSKRDIKTSKGLQAQGADSTICVYDEIVIVDSEVESVEKAEYEPALDSEHPIWQQLLEDLEEIGVAPDPDRPNTRITISLNESGAQKLKFLSANNIGGQLVVTSNGIAIYVPVIFEAVLDGRFQIQ